MKFTIDKHNFYTSENKVIAVSSFAGQAVRGIAKCDPEDAFSLDYGKKLAAARGDVKVAAKRMKRAWDKFNEAEANVIKAKRRSSAMWKYCTDAKDDYVTAKNRLEKILSEVE